MEQRPTRVLLLEDENLSRTLLAKVISDEGYEVMAAEDINEALDFIDNEQVDIIVTDIDLGAGQNGLDFLTSVKIENPSFPAIVLSSYRIPISVQEFLKEQTAYFDKKQLGDFSELLNSIKHFSKGKKTKLTKSLSPLDTLSKQQLDVLRLIATGYSNQEIADLRSTSLRAAEQTIHRMFNKLELNRDPKTNPRVIATKLYLDTFGAALPSDNHE
jgi:DNA-binding NarL/FixJ family response regulator